MLFVFDWDGTLCDSTHKIVSCMQQAAKLLELSPLSDTDVRNIIGLGLPEAVRHLYPDISDTQAKALQLKYSKVFTENDQDPSLFFDGVEESLVYLRDAGYQLTIATGKSRRGLDRVLKSMGLSEFFHGSRCADETASKPHPKMLNELLEDFKCDPSEAVMVGDTEFDMDMARRAGVPRVAVSYGAHHIDRLKPYEPVLCMDDFPELLSLLPATATEI